MHAALALAYQVAHAASLAHAELFAALLAQWCRDVPAVQGHADALMSLGEEHGFTHRLEQVWLLRGWVLAMQGEAARGVAQIRQGLAATQGRSLKLFHPYFLAVLAEAYGRAGQPQAGLQVLAEAMTLIATTEIRWWEAEVYRLQGELLLHLPSPDVPQAEAAFLRALDVARRQQAKALELRAALSLARLWHQHDQWEAARDLLAPLYAWFTEGLDTPDLQEVRTLLATIEPAGVRTCWRIVLES
jgi:predicted ATPase